MYILKEELHVLKIEYHRQDKNKISSLNVILKMNYGTLMCHIDNSLHCLDGSQACSL